jgi:hypothetical protein
MQRIFSKTEVLGSHVEVSIGERYMRMPTVVDAGKVTFSSIWRTLAATLAPGQTAKLTAYLEPGTYDVIASSQSGPTKALRTELTVRPE